MPLIHKGDTEFEIIEHAGKVRETDKATLFAFEEGEQWVPKSLIEDEDEETVSIPYWLAKKMGLL